MKDTPKPQVTVLPPGPQKEINWTVREYIGVEVYRPPAGLTLEQLRDKSQWPEDFEMEPIKDKLKTGEYLLVPGLFGGIFLGTVKASPEGEPYFLSTGGSMMGILEYSTDDRECWTCGGLANVKAIQRLKLEK